MSLITLDVLLADLLAAAEVALTGTVKGVPDCSRISHGEPTWPLTESCELLTVHGRVTSEPLSPTKAGCAIVSVGHFAVTLLRCVTALGADGSPSCDLLDSEATELAADGWALWAGLLAAWKDGSLIPALSCQRIVFHELIPLKPFGGLAGWRLTLTTRVPSGAGS